MDTSTAIGTGSYAPVYPGTIPGLGLPGAGAGLPLTSNPGGLGAATQPMPQQPTQGAAAAAGPSANNQVLSAISPVMTPGIGAAAYGTARPKAPPQAGFPLADIGMQVMR